MPVLAGGLVLSILSIHKNYVVKNNEKRNLLWLPNFTTKDWLTGGNSVVTHFWETRLWKEEANAFESPWIFVTFQNSKRKTEDKVKSNSSDEANAN